MKILIADKFEQSGVEGLNATGSEVFVEPDLSGSTLTARLESLNPEIVIVRSTQVAAPMLEAGKALSLVIRAGAGVNTIDLAAASARGIFVANCPGKNAIAVAELTLGLILSLDRRIPENTQRLHDGVWDKKEFSKARGLFGRALGIAGFGTIGREVARRARAFGLTVYAWSRSLTPEKAEEAGVIHVASVTELARGCDIISLHLAAAPETRGLFGAEFFAAMKPGAFFINTARADLVDPAALEKAIADKKIRAALDVFPQEPASPQGAITDALAKNPAVTGTHHIGASTEQAQEAIAAETVRIVRTFLEAGKVDNCVNIARRPPATHMLVVRHRDRVGVLAHVLGALKSDGISVQGMENVIFEGAEAACARIELDHQPHARTLETIAGGSDDIYSVTVSKLD